MLRLEVDGGASEFAPGQTIHGTATWQLDSAPASMTLRLFWYTLGKGTQDVEIVSEVVFDNPQMSESRRFTFTLPNAPYSFSGTLISLKWALELILGDEREVARLDILLSPWVTELKLEQETATTG